jgi:DNA/RNA-binding domain of Phe-tRNA-synthetase-like protein
MSIFEYHPEILQAFPGVVGGVIYSQGFQNGPSPSDLLSVYQAQQRETRAMIGDTPLSELTALQAWRRAFRSFGVKPTQYRSAIEALLRRLMKAGDIPSINACVDIANLVSIRYHLPVAVFDTHPLQLPIQVHFSDGTERFTTLHQSESTSPDPGEVIFSDRARVVVARRWCWRQSAGSAAVLGTHSAVITVEAQHRGAHPEVQAAVADLLSLTSKYLGGSSSSGMLDANHPGF